MGRSVLAVFAGLIMGIFVIGLIKWAGHQLFPLPAGLDINDTSQMAEYAQSAPVGALFMVLVAWFFGACDGAMIAAWLAPQQPWRHGFIVVGLLLLAAVAMLISLPHPQWLVLATPVIYLLAALIGCKVGSMLHDRRRAGIAR